MVDVHFKQSGQNINTKHLGRDGCLGRAVANLRNSLSLLQKKGYFLTASGSVFAAKDVMKIAMLTTILICKSLLATAQAADMAAKNNFNDEHVKKIESNSNMHNQQKPIRIRPTAEIPKKKFMILQNQNVTARQMHGGSSDGGGSSCQRSDLNQGNPITLDLALFNSTIVDPSTTGTKIMATDLANAIGYDQWNPTANASFQFAISRIQDWRSKNGSSRSMGLLLRGIQSINFIMTPMEIKKLSRVSLPAGARCELSDLNTVALYKAGFVNVSIPSWNSLGLYSQAAIIIHEGLRNIQISQGLSGADWDLEFISSTILSQYDGTTRLDELPFFFGYTHLQSIRRAKTCEALQRFLEKFPPQANATFAIHLNDFCESGNDLETDDQIKNTLSKARTLEQDLVTVDSLPTSPAGSAAAINDAYVEVDAYMSLVLQRMAFLHDFIFNNTLIGIQGVNAGLNLARIRNAFNDGNISDAKLAMARKFYEKYLESTE